MPKRLGLGQVFANGHAALRVHDAVSLHDHRLGHHGAILDDG
jgi:hypothetical protein